MGVDVNYYPFHLGDYAAHTAHLEPMEDLAYRRMLDLYYMRECALPQDVAEVARLIRMRPHVESVEAVLREFFLNNDGEGWIHVRCEAEITKMQDKQAKARASAEASVNARKASAKRTLNERSTVVELPTPTPTPTPTQKDKESAAPADADTPPPQKQKAKPATTLKTYLSRCRELAEKPVPEGHSIRKWARDAGITDEMLQIAWVKFKERYTEAEKGVAKSYKDWPGHFATSVKDNWFGVWFFGDDGLQWSSKGMTFRSVMDQQTRGGNEQG